MTVHCLVSSAPLGGLDGPPVLKDSDVGEVLTHALGIGFAPVPATFRLAVKLPLFLGAVTDWTKKVLPPGANAQSLAGGQVVKIPTVRERAALGRA